MVNQVVNGLIALVDRTMDLFVEPRLMTTASKAAPLSRYILKVLATKEERSSSLQGAQSAERSTR